VSGEAVLSAENSGKLLGGTGLRPKLQLGELTALPQIPYLMVRGLLPLPTS